MGRLIACLLVISLLSPHVDAADTVSSRIDSTVEARAHADGVPVGPVADDAEFHRRVWLDFAGKIPTAEQTRSFLADTSSDKREKLLNQLLDGPDYANRMADFFHVMLMERLGDAPEWSKYLRDSFTKNKPWDQMAREILRANSKDTVNIGAAFFLAKRLENYGQNPVDYSGLTRDVGRLFLGKNFQCCECHDHLFVEDYKQQHFQGLHAFFRNTLLVSLPKLQVGERPTTEKLPFASVFTKMQMATSPALPGAAMIEIPTFPKGMEFAEPADKKTGSPGVPKFSTLAAISEQLPKASNRDFTRNMANRLWFALMGRGLVHPLDMHHSQNPGLHPELLDLLASEFALHKFDIKWLLREIALSKAYQRSGRYLAGAEPPEAKYFATAIEKRVSAEQFLASLLVATGADPKLADTLRPKFLKAFANQARDPEDEIAPSLNAALFLSHDEAVLGLLRPQPENLVDRLSSTADDRFADDLYLAILSRKPTPEEAATVGKVLTRHAGKKTEAARRLAWALIASMEFGVNH